MIELQKAIKANHMAQLRALFQEYAETRKNDPALVDFPEEINDLPGRYAPPTGAIILAHYDGKRAGCVALQRLDDDICEMKRLYLSSNFRGRGVGKCSQSYPEASTNVRIFSNAFRLHPQHGNSSSPLQIYGFLCNTWLPEQSE